jgi:hypothetical protein
MRQITIGFAVLCMSLTAFAGKTERDLMTKQVVPAVTNAEAKLKSQCGCAVKITVDEATLKSMDDLRGARHIADAVAKGAEAYCTDAPSKKAICQMKTLTIAKAKPAGFTFKDGAGTATTDGQASCSWQQITRVLDR